MPDVQHSMPFHFFKIVITFFKYATTKDMFEKLKPAIALLDKYNRPYDIVYTNFVGTIVYEDEWQVAVNVKDGKMDRWLLKVVYI